MLSLALAAMAALQLFLPNTVQLPPEGAAARTGFGGSVVNDPAPVVPNALLGSRSPFAPARAGIGGGAAEGPLGGAVIAGSVTVGAIRFAMVQDADGGIRRVAPGGGISGWRLDAVMPSGARLRRGHERIEVPYGARPAAKAQRDNQGEDQ
jgi:hypothetical protein